MSVAVISEPTKRYRVIMPRLFRGPHNKRKEVPVGDIIELTDRKAHALRGKIEPELHVSDSTLARMVQAEQARDRAEQSNASLKARIAELEQQSLSVSSGSKAAGNAPQEVDPPTGTVASKAGRPKKVEKAEAK